MALPLQNKFNTILKRAFDLLVAALLTIAILSWLTVLVAIVNRLFYGMGTFFTQKRTGQYGVPFQCFKFKTMRDAPKKDVLPTEVAEDRLTTFGLWLRNTGLDELPQLLNVLLGQMSLIGPRPYMEMENGQLAKSRRNFMQRYQLKPGISGWAQVHGHKGRMYTLTDIEQRLELDLEYIHNWSFALDIQIFMLSIWQAAMAMFGVFYKKEKERKAQPSRRPTVLSLEKQEV